jgi:hypothetical protein
VGYCYPSGLEKTLCKWEVYVPLVTKGLKERRGWKEGKVKQEYVGQTKEMGKEYRREVGR